MLEKSLGIYKMFCEKISREKANLKETDHQIKKIEKQVFALRPRQITDAQCNQRVQSGRQTIETLKNTLDNSVKRFCATLAENRKTRTEIDHLLKEREHFNQLYERKLRALNDAKTKIFELVERATVAYDQREEWCNKLQALHTRNHNDTILHNREMRELQRRLDYDTNLHEFLQVKGQKRVMRDLEIKERKRREFERAKHERELKTYEETLEQIKTLTGEENAQRLASRYLKQEEENFALFNYVNEIGVELEDLEETIGRFIEQIAEQREQNELREQQQEKTAVFLDGELVKAKLEASESKRLLADKRGELEKLLREIEGLFVDLGCEKGPALDLVGRKPGITRHNVFVYLETIEKKIENALHAKMLI